MSRKTKISSHQIIADHKYGCIILSKFINYTMKHGRKHTARRIVYGALDILEKYSTNQNNLDMLRQAIKILSPQVQVKAKRVGGSTYQVPIPVSLTRSQFLGCSWLLQGARKRSEHTMAERLANEIADVLKGKGAAFKRKEDMYKTVAANKSFAHLR